MNVLKLAGEGVLNQNTIGAERDCHEFRGYLSQLIVFNSEKSEQEIAYIEDILCRQANFSYPLN